MARNGALGWFVHQWILKFKLAKLYYLALVLIPHPHNSIQVKFELFVIIAF